MGMRWRCRWKPNSMPWWKSPSLSRRSPTPDCRSMSTVPCSSTPARMRSSQCCRECTSTTTEWMSCRCRRCESIRPAGPAPTMATCVCIFDISASSGVPLPGRIHFRKHLLRQMKGGVRCRNSTVDGALQQGLLDLFPRHAVVRSGADVHREFLISVETGHERQRDQATCMAGQARARPNLAPRIARDQVLKLGVECGGRHHCPVHMLVPQHRPPHLHARIEAIFVIHDGTSAVRKKESTALLKSFNLRHFALRVPGYPGLVQ